MTFIAMLNQNRAIRFSKNVTSRGSGSRPLAECAQQVISKIVTARNAVRWMGGGIASGSNRGGNARITCRLWRITQVAAVDLPAAGAARGPALLHFQVSSLHVPEIPVRDFAKTAAKRFGELAMGDAPAATWGKVRNLRQGLAPCPCNYRVHLPKVGEGACP